MISIVISAAFVGLVHSLAPGHWLPVVLMVKAKRWPVRTAVAGAFVTAAGHVVVSTAVGLLAIGLGARFLSSAAMSGAMENRIEGYAGLGCIAFGILYALHSVFRHSSCHGHEHHGPDPRRGSKAPFVFLFSLGLSPCVAALPIFAAAAIQGSVVTLVTLIAFSLGVLSALVGATLLVSTGLMKLDHPWLEHYGDVITGGAVALMGAILFWMSR